MKNKNLRYALLAFINLTVILIGSILASTVGEKHFLPEAVDATVLRALSIVVLTGLLIILIIEIISAFKISDSTFHTTLFAAAVFLMYLFSPDMRYNLKALNVDIPELALEFLGYAAFLFAIITDIIFIDFTYRPNIEIQLKKTVKTAVFTLTPIGFCLYIGLSFVNLQFIGHLVVSITALVVILIYSKHIFEENKQDPTYTLILLIASATIGMENVNVMYYSDLIRHEIIGYPLGYAFFIIIMFGYVYTAFIIRSERKIRMSNEYKLQTEQLRTTILTQQMKPHFIFNSLATIKAMYHKNLEDGDCALDLFSKQLRSDIEAIDKELIPLEDELEYVQNYVEFENLKRENDRINVIFNIENADFYVPALSLQPLVENAVKHGQIDKKEDGNIIIASYIDDGAAVIEITDNGVGFDVSTVRKGSCGVNNTRARFEILLNADMVIRSEIGVGTTVTIRITEPRFSNENNNS